MATAKADLNAKTAELSEEVFMQPVKSRSRLLIWLAFVALIFFELIIIAWLLPRGTTIVQNQPLPVGPIPDPGPFSIPDPGSFPKPGDLIEFPIPDPFTCMIPDENPDRGGFVIRAKFTLKYPKDKERTFTLYYDKVKSEIRASILEILRKSTVKDITDPRCTTIRNRITQKVNEIFTEPIVKDVITDDFNATPM